MTSEQVYLVKDIREYIRKDYWLRGPRLLCGETYRKYVSAQVSTVIATS